MHANEPHVCTVYCVQYTVPYSAIHDNGSFLAKHANIATVSHVIAFLQSNFNACLGVQQLSVPIWARIDCD